MVIFVLKKNGVVIGAIIFIIIIVISIALSDKAKDDSVEDVSTVEYDASYYVEADGNIFIKLADICDDCCYYAVDMIFNGVERVFSSLLDN